MPSLSERLKSLGVKVGTQGLPPPKPVKSFPVEDVVPGRFLETHGGNTFLIEEEFPNDYIHGEVGLRISTRPHVIAEWAGVQHIVEQQPEAYAFLDTETSGLAGGTGTFAFLIGVGRYTQAGFQLAQFFMRDPFEEPALLVALEEFLAPCQTIVSFNGKAFDVPLLDARYTLQGWKSPFKNLGHVDLLHLARRLWRDRLPSRTLANLEVQILHASRTDEEIPGWMIPQLYFDYLRDGDARPLKRVFYHNAMDVVSLAALLNHTSALLENPVARSADEYIDLAAVARLMEDLGHTNEAARLYETCLQSDLPESVLFDTTYRLSQLYKRNYNHLAAIPLWEKAAAGNKLYAFEELAKYYEHVVQDLPTALQWSAAALTLLDTEGILDPDCARWKHDFQHRLQRLERKISAQP